MDETQDNRGEVLGLFEAMKQEIIHGVQGLVLTAQSEIMRTFLQFAECSHIRIRAIEAKLGTTDAALGERMSILERRLSDIEKRLMLDISGIDPKTPLQ